MAKLNKKNIQFNESNLSVLKYFTLLEKNTYELSDFKNLLKELKAGQWYDNLDSPYRLQELTIITHIKAVIKTLTSIKTK
jgi:hypothetical protein